MHYLSSSFDQTYNMLCGDGRTRPFETVPFINGDDPTDPQTVRSISLLCTYLILCL